MFLVNKYTRIYFQLIYKRKVTNPLTKSKKLYTENHHIIPRCISKDDSPENMVRLTYREHLLCHLLLTKFINKSYNKRWYYSVLKSCNMMINHKSKNRTYSLIQLSLVKETQKKLEMTDETKKKLSIAKTGKSLSEEHKISISQGLKGLKKPKDFRIGSKQSEETKNKISIGNTGKKRSEEHCQNQSKRKKGLLSGEKHFFYGKPVSEERRKNISDALKGRRCPPFSEEHKEKIRQSNMGHDVSEETKKKISDKQKKWINLKCWINNGSKSLKINKEDLSYYLSLGWNSGRGRVKF